MFGVAEVTATATARIRTILSICPPPILGTYGVEKNTATATLTIKFDGWGSQKA